MDNRLVHLDREAFALRNSGKFAQAAIILEQLLTEEPEWEHGYGFLSLAGCYEELGRNDEAREAYKSALRFSPNDILILGGYASFLYLNGDPLAALSAYLRLLSIEGAQGDQSFSEDTKVAIRTLGSKLGKSVSVIEEEILSAENTHSKSSENT